MSLKTFQNRVKMGSIAAKMEPKWRQDGVKTGEKSVKKATQQKRGGTPQSRSTLVEKVDAKKRPASGSEVPGVEKIKIHNSNRSMRGCYQRISH